MSAGMSEGMEVYRVNKQFWEACSRGDIGGVVEGLDKGADVNFGGHANGDSGLTMAIKDMHNEVVEILLAQPSVNVNFRNGKDWTPLHSACANHNPHAVERLVSDVRLTQESLNLREQVFGQAPLMLAVYKGNIEAVRLLTEVEGIDLMTENKFGDDLIKTAKLNKENYPQEIADKILKLIQRETDSWVPVQKKKEVSLPKDKQKIFTNGIHLKFWEACAAGNLERVQNRLSGGANVNTFVEGTTALMIAIIKHQNPIVLELLVNPNLDLNWKSWKKWTALHSSVSEGNLEALRAILKDPRLMVVTLNQKEEMYGQSPLMLAVFKSKTAAVLELLKMKGIDLKTTNNCGHGLVQVAQSNLGRRATSASRETLDILFSFQVYSCKTCGLVSCSCSEMCKLEKLQKSREVSPNRINLNLIEACLKGRLEDLKRLLSCGADVNYLIDLGTGLTISISQCHTQLAEELMKHPYIDVNKVNQCGSTALHCAVNWKNPIIVEKLIQHPGLTREGLNWQESDQLQSPLMLAVVQGEVSSVRLLAQAPGLDWQTENRAGHSLLQALIVSGQPEHVMREVRGLIQARPRVTPRYSTAHSHLILW